MVNDSMVSIVNTTVYGRSKKYKLDDTSEETLVQWAVETSQLLQAHPELAKAKRILDDSITPEAKESLWSCSERLSTVPKDYPAGTISVANRVIFHQEWLQKIIDACAATSTPLVLNKMREIKWGEGATGGASGQDWTARDIMIYYARLKELETRQGGAMSVISEKAKLEVVENRIPSGLKRLAKATLPRHAGVGPTPVDTWEKALTRVAHELKKQEDCAALQETIRMKQRHDDHTPSVQKYKRKRDGEQRGVDRMFKKSKWRPDSSSGGERRSKGKGKGSGKGSSGRSASGGRSETDISHIECFNCNKKGHYANNCPDAPKDASRGGGKGKGKSGGKGRGNGKGSHNTQKGDVKA